MRRSPKAAGQAKARTDGGGERALAAGDRAMLDRILGRKAFWPSGPAERLLKVLVEHRVVFPIHI